MNRRNLVLICSIAIAMGSLPGAAALWSSSGNLEPDYAEDVTLQFMFTQPDVDPNPEHMQVYFNGFMSPVWSGANPNVAATGSSIMSPANNGIALLGVWKDCNDDGYIGHAESAVVEYRSVLLTDPSICEDGTPFNNEGWVYELLTIIDGASFAQNAKPVRFINSSDVRVWADTVLPPAEQPQDGGSDNSCFTNPPIGFAYSTGSMLDFSDCLIGHTVVQAVTDLDNGELCFESDEAGQNVCQPEGTGTNAGIGFDNCADDVACEESQFDGGEDAQCSDSLLNQRIGVWSDAPECRQAGYVGLMDACGEPEARAPDAPEDTCDEENDPYPNAFFTVWDCSSETPVSDSTGVLAADDPETDEDESVLLALPGGVSPTTPGLNDPSHRSLSQGADEALATCDGSANVGTTATLVETDVEQGDTKVTNDWVMPYQPPFQNRNIWEGNTCGLTVAGTLVGLPPGTPVTNSSGCTTRLLPDSPSSAGTRPPIQSAANGGPNYWSGVMSFPFLHPNVETRGTGADTTVDGESAFYVTFYASVAETGTTFDEFVTGEPNHFEQATATILFPGGEGFYGEEWCDGDYGAGAGVFGGWECDASLWYADSEGGSTRPTVGDNKPQGAVPGETYNLRDIDCYDGSVAAGQSADLEGVGLGLTFLDTDGSGPCHYVRS